MLMENTFSLRVNLVLIQQIHHRTIINGKFQFPTKLLEIPLSGRGFISKMIALKCKVARFMCLGEILKALE